MKVKRLFTIPVLALVATMLASCAAASPVDYSYVDVDEAPSFSEGSTMQKLSDSGRIRVGVAFDKPYFGLRGLNGEMQGFDIEMARIVAGKLGIPPQKIEFVETTSANREPFIEQGKVDVVIATYTINDERKEVVSFAGPYLIAGQALLVGDRSPKDIVDINSAAGHSVCSVTGSTGYEHIREDYPEVAKNLVGFDTYSKCGAALANGQVDAMTADNTTLAGVISNNPESGFKIVGKEFSEEPYGMGIARNDDDFRTFLNDVIEQAQSDGQWQDAWNRTAGEVLTDEPEPPAVERY
jgi:glutamate transport system substrate-binding protein